MILDQIAAHKVNEVEDRKRRSPVGELRARLKDMEPVRDFASALRSGRPSIIAEVKKASPSKGIIRSNFKPVEIARTYQENGASAVSVLTDERFFHGHLSYLAAIKRSVTLPVLRKDFIIDEYQLVEARSVGADAVLLIVALLELPKLKHLYEEARELGLYVLTEVHDERELETAVAAGVDIIGVNNRDLKTFKTDIGTTFRLRGLMPEDKIRVSESGINTREDIHKLVEAGIDAALIGEALMRETDIGSKLRELLS